MKDKQDEKLKYLLELEDSEPSEDELDATRELRMKKKCDPLAKTVPKKKSATTVCTDKTQTKRKLSEVSCSGTVEKKQKVTEVIGGSKKPAGSKKVSFEDSKPSKGKKVSTVVCSKAKACVGRPPVAAPGAQPKRFLSKKARKRYGFLSEKEFLVERNVVFGELDEFDLESVIRKGDLVSTMTRLPAFVDNVIWELYAHLPEEKVTKKEVQVYVRA